MNIVFILIVAAFGVTVIAFTYLYIEHSRPRWRHTYWGNWIKILPRDRALTVDHTREGWRIYYYHRGALAAPTLRDDLQMTWPYYPTAQAAMEAADSRKWE